VAAKWMLPEPDSAAALELFVRYEAGEISLIAPDLLLAEFASVLAKRSRRKQISTRGRSTPWIFRHITRCPCGIALLTGDRRLFRAGGGRHPSLRLVQ